MSCNTFGKVFRITTWGESHGPAIGAVIDGCPAGVPIELEAIDRALSRRAPGHSAYTSPRKENDRAEILSGVFRGRSTGAPIQLLIHNRDADSSAYGVTEHLLRPGHANATYLAKYGIVDHRGGGRASARETAARVAAAAVADSLLEEQGIYTLAFLKGVGSHSAPRFEGKFEELSDFVSESDLFCPDRHTESAIKAALKAVMEEGDSLGGVVEFLTEGVPAGLGTPIYGKLDAELAYAMLSIPASKGFEIGEGFEAATFRGSSHNDSFVGRSERGYITSTNSSGGTLGGISTGMPLSGRVAFKPTSSIRKPMETITREGEPATLNHPENSRHDPCVAIRAVPVVKAMLSLVLADALLLQRLSRWQ